MPRLHRWYAVAGAGRTFPAQQVDPNACPACNRVIAYTKYGRRFAHNDKTGRPCPGTGLRRNPERFEELPPVQGAFEPRSEGCECGWRPKRKNNGEFAAHRIRPDDPTAPYCEFGAARSY